MSELKKRQGLSSWVSDCTRVASPGRFWLALKQSGRAYAGRNKIRHLMHWFKRRCDGYRCPVAIATWTINPFVSGQRKLLIQKCGPARRKHIRCCTGCEVPLNEVKDLFNATLETTKKLPPVFLDIRTRALRHPHLRRVHRHQNPRTNGIDEACRLAALLRLLSRCWHRFRCRLHGETDERFAAAQWFIVVFRRHQPASRAMCRRHTGSAVGACRVSTKDSAHPACGAKRLSSVFICTFMSTA